MKGFDAEFRDLDHYIRVITDRIWEGRRLDDIYRYYSDPCAVETPGSVTTRVEDVVEGTRATLRAFPDRRLLAEDVIVSGDEHGGFLSSHRIFSPMTHAGSGPFGLATGRAVHVRTIADCVCIGNRIVHEWLVRDQGAIARQIGVEPRSLAQRWLDERGGWNKPAMPSAPLPYVSHVETQGPAAAYGSHFVALWRNGDTSLASAIYAEDVIVALPGNARSVGVDSLLSAWQAWRAALHVERLDIEHLTANERPGRATAVAMRWRLSAWHNGDGVLGPASRRPVEILGISHAEIEAERVVREWILFDEVALWMQVLQPAATSTAGG